MVVPTKNTRFSLNDMTVDHDLANWQQRILDPLHQQSRCDPSDFIYRLGNCRDPRLHQRVPLHFVKSGDGDIAGNVDLEFGNRPQHAGRKLAVSGK